MLMNDFYSLREIQSTESDFTALISFNADHAIFKGHFPQQPIVPGVCMMQIVKEVLEQETGKKLILNNAPQVKFLQLITPEITPSIHLKWVLEEGFWNVQASLKTEKDLFKMNGRFAERN